MKFNKITLKMVREKSYDYNSQKITSALDIVKLINGQENIVNNTDESVYIICLNTKNQIVNFMEIAKSGADFCNLDMKAIFKPILLCNANKFILIHNHPSGDCIPSKYEYSIEGDRQLLNEHIVECLKENREWEE